jgi:hypothetical protein
MSRRASSRRPRPLPRLRAARCPFPLWPCHPHSIHQPQPRCVRQGPNHLGGGGFVFGGGPVWGFIALSEPFLNCLPTGLLVDGHSNCCIKGSYAALACPSFSAGMGEQLPLSVSRNSTGCSSPPPSAWPNGAWMPKGAAHSLPLAASQTPQAPAQVCAPTCASVLPFPFCYCFHVRSCLHVWQADRQQRRGRGVDWAGEGCMCAVADLPTPPYQMGV